MAIAPLNHHLSSAMAGMGAVGAPLPAQAHTASRVQPPGDSQSADMSPDDDELAHAVRSLNSRLTAWSTNLRFEIDQDTSRVVVQVVDIESGDVVRQIPSEEVLHMSKMLGKLHDLSFRASA